MHVNRAAIREQQATGNDSQMRVEKKSIVEEIRRVLEGATMLILTDGTGLSSTSLHELRAVLKKGGGRYLVVTGGR